MPRLKWRQRNAMSEQGSSSFLCGQVTRGGRWLWLAGAISLARRAHPPDVEIADLLAQGIPVQPQQFGGLDLIAAGRGERRGNQRILDFLRKTL